jgi:hypothetical protein
VTRGFVANEDRSVACIQRVSNSLGKVSIKLIDTGYVLCARSEVEEDFAFVVRRGLVTSFNSGQESTARKHMNSDENPNENESDNQVRATTEAVDEPQPAACENDEVKRDK